MAHGNQHNEKSLRSKKLEGEEMPTSPDEAIKIYSIINEYMEISTAEELTRRLDDEVGQVSKNQSLKESLEMLRALYE